MKLASRTWEVIEADRSGAEVESIAFAIYDDGDVVVSENWSGKDELWGAGVSIIVPKRIWREFIKWYAEVDLSQPAEGGEL